MRACTAAAGPTKVRMSHRWACCVGVAARTRFLNTNDNMEMSLSKSKYFSTHSPKHATSFSETLSNPLQSFSLSLCSKPRESPSVHSSGYGHSREVRNDARILNRDGNLLAWNACTSFAFASCWLASPESKRMPEQNWRTKSVLVLRMMNSSPV
jgi:hypothetical protein